MTGFRTTSVPMVASSGRMASNTAGSAPTMIARVPSTAAWRVRAIGASAACAPRAAAAAAISRASAGGEVDISIRTWPARSRPRIPPGPSTSSRTSAPPGRQVITASAASTTSTAEAAARAPAAAIPASASGFRSKAVTGQDPLAIRLRHIAPPMTPNPINPIRSKFPAITGAAVMGAAVMGAAVMGAVPLLRKCCGGGSIQ